MLKFIDKDGKEFDQVILTPCRDPVIIRAAKVLGLTVIDNTPAPTGEEVAMASAIKTLFPKAEYLENKYGMIYVIDEFGLQFSIALSTEKFPCVLPGEKVKLIDIIEERIGAELDDEIIGKEQSE